MQAADRAQLQEIVGHCEKRVSRAAEKRVAAMAEHSAALHALDACKLRLAQWIEANPDPQGSLFEEKE